MNWDPTQFFRENHPPNPFALLILNQPINEQAFRILKNHTHVTVCADGGANRFHEMTKSHGTESSDVPTLIIGDLDSIHASTRAHYADLGVRVVEDRDQNSTDFTKCLVYLREHLAEFIPSSSASSVASSASSSSSVGTEEEEEEEEEGGRCLDVLVLGGLGGRVDQAFSQIHHLFHMAQVSSSGSKAGQGGIGNLYLISEESITFILRPGVNVIRTPRTRRSDLGRAASDADLLEENVGIIPLLGPARITTSGLEWDVQDWATEIGGRLSTSNHIRSEVVRVESAVPVLFTLELAERLKRTR
ncbi:thiamine pyrophosphokinase [Aspergillus coremiiformis]|uniref:Thiamine pyrophosphokinase n=1 Tax=Aspergillus coremiiformis TaxID=138285 RepID=A0A5N6Z800_9EURO|nr:thiamine pyrophosphokinase [Aspergillus coremiiformis]